MIIGIMADTHDNLNALKKAVKFFSEKQVKLVVHAGDFIAPFVLDELKKLNCRFIGVFGNNDGDKKTLAELSQMAIKIAPLETTMGDNDDVKVFIYHGHENIFAGNLVERGFKLVISAHTHTPEIKEDRGTLFINPGETGGWVSGKSTIVLCDVDKLEAELVELD